MVAIVTGKKYEGWKLPPVFKDKMIVWRNVTGYRFWRQTAECES